MGKNKDKRACKAGPEQAKLPEYRPEKSAKSV
jgi:hypothetical protein